PGLFIKEALLFRGVRRFHPDAEYRTVTDPGLAQRGERIGGVPEPQPGPGAGVLERLLPAPEGGTPGAGGVALGAPPAFGARVDDHAPDPLALQRELRFEPGLVGQLDVASQARGRALRSSGPGLLHEGAQAAQPLLATVGPQHLVNQRLELC